MRKFVYKFLKNSNLGEITTVQATTITVHPSIYNFLLSDVEGLYIHIYGIIVVNEAIPQDTVFIKFSIPIRASGVLILMSNQGGQNIFALVGGEDRKSVINTQSVIPVGNYMIDNWIRIL